jgi:hypothetical protein
LSEQFTMNYQEFAATTSSSLRTTKARSSLRTTKASIVRFELLVVHIELLVVRSELQALDPALKKLKNRQERLGSSH